MLGSVIDSLGELRDSMRCYADEKSILSVYSIYGDEYFTGQN